MATFQLSHPLRFELGQGKPSGVAQDKQAGPTSGAPPAITRGKTGWEFV